MQIPAFAKHLKELTDAGRGYTLQVSGERWRHFYRFANPLLQPFVILRGLSDKLIDESLLMGGPRRRATTDDPSDSGPLS
jgi:hypothetical protein